MKTILRPYDRFVASLPALIAAHPGKPPEMVFERLRQAFRAQCPNASDAQYGAGMDAIREAMNK